MSGIISLFFRASPPKAGAALMNTVFAGCAGKPLSPLTLAYVTFYVCRLSFTVAKSALVELGITPTELGMIGSTLFLQLRHRQTGQWFYRRSRQRGALYEPPGLLLSAGMNLMMGMTTPTPRAGHLLGDQRLGAVDGRRGPCAGLAGALVRR